MQEDLKHIELIDKYLNGTLSQSEKNQVEKLLVNDSDFAKEVAVYKKIYEGIAQKEETDLKKRLGSYFEEYEIDQKTVAGHRSKGKYRRMFIYGGALAACLVIGGAILFLSKYDGTISNLKPNTVDVDTTTIKKSDSIFHLNEEKLAEEEKQDKSRIDQSSDDNLVNQEKDSIQVPGNIDDERLALGGYKTLPPKAVRRYTYSKSLSYTFQNGVFKLYGDPLVGRLDLLSLRILKNRDSDYFLSFKNDYYNIEETQYKKLLLKIEDPKNNSGFGTLFSNFPKLTPSEEEIKISVASIENTSMVLSKLTVRFKEGAPKDKTYFFNKNEEHLELIINADLNIEKSRVYKIIESGQNYYYLVQENEIYALDEKVKEPTPLTLVEITTNKLARLFIDRESVKTVVYLEK